MSEQQEQAQPAINDKMKQKALEIAENHAMQAIDDVYALAQVYVEDTSTPLDNTFLEGLKLLKGTLKKFADKIDGKDDVQ